MAEPDQTVEAEASKYIEQIGRRIAELRHAAGWSQRQFATVLNSTVQWVSMVETGRQNLRIHTLVRIAHKLGVPPADLWVPPAGTATTSARGRKRAERA